jgi:hypothetical protein
VETITKVVAGQTPEIGQYLAKIYGSVNNSNIFVAKNIKTAEAAKVIENTQRDINIAFMNELAAIFGQMNLSIYDVLAAARTKWNFLPFTPGLVGGHCIGVDPYYLANLSRSLNHEPQVILAGRRVNEDMSRWIAQRLHGLLQKPSKVLILGLTFKENVPDLRNTKIIDLIKALKQFGHHIDVHDAFADPEEAQEYYQLSLVSDLGSISKDYDMVLGAVSHEPYTTLSAEEIPIGLPAEETNRIINESGGRAVALHLGDKVTDSISIDTIRRVNGNPDPMTHFAFVEGFNAATLKVEKIAKIPVVGLIVRLSPRGRKVDFASQRAKEFMDDEGLRYGLRDLSGSDSHYGKDFPDVITGYPAGEDLLGAALAGRTWTLVREPMYYPTPRKFQQQKSLLQRRNLIP